MEDKIKEAMRWLKSQAIEIDWGHGQQLSSADIDSLLAGATSEIEDRLFEFNTEHIWELELGLIKQAADDFGVDKDELEPCMAVDYNLSSLVRNTQAHISVPLNVEHIVRGQDDYDSVEIELKSLGFNPKDVCDGWPDIPGREPLLSIDGLWELWTNDFYGGGYVALLNCRMVLKAALEGKLAKMSILKAGAAVTIYNYWNGSGSMFVTTKRDREIDPSEIERDGKYVYGIQRCYGLVQEVWSGMLSEKAKENDGST